MSKVVQKQPYSDPKRWIQIYPAYLDAKKTQVQGRKVPKDKAIPAPTSVEMQQVLEAAGLNTIIEPGKMYSRDQDREPESQGRVRVQLKNDDGSVKNKDFPTRASILLHLCEMIPKLKTRQPGYVPPSSSAAGGNKKNKKKK